MRNRIVSEEGLYAITQSPGLTGPPLHGTQSGKMGTVITRSPTASNVGSILVPSTCNHTRVLVRTQQQPLSNMLNKSDTGQDLLAASRRSSGAHRSMVV